MSHEIGRTADGQPIRVGEWYWNNDLKPCQVLELARTEYHEGERRYVPWYRTTRGLFSDDRLAKKFEGQVAEGQELRAELIR